MVSSPVLLLLSRPLRLSRQRPSDWLYSMLQGVQWLGSKLTLLPHTHTPHPPSFHYQHHPAIFTCSTINRCVPCRMHTTAQQQHTHTNTCMHIHILFECICIAPFVFFCSETAFACVVSASVSASVSACLLMTKFFDLRGRGVS